MANAAQKRNRSLIAIAGSALLAFTIGFEGNKLVGYADPVGIPTACVGHTGPEVKVGQKYTPQQCNALLVKDMTVHGQAVLDLVTVDLTQPTYDALADFTFNVGVGAFKRSILLKKLNAGDYQGACDELPKWNKAGGKVLPGLTKRRAAEYKLCIQYPKVKRK